MKELPKVYDPKLVEKKIYDMWIEGGYFHAHRDPEKKPFTIVIPPPNVTGQLHLGHAFDETIQDVLIRYKRMRVSALWVPGTDHAGIATQIKVEEKLREEGLTRFDLGREKFVERVWEWKEKYGGLILEQLKSLGCSCDWERLRFTMDEICAKAVLEVFVRLYEKGLSIRAAASSTHCPSAQPLFPTRKWSMRTGTATSGISVIRLGCDESVLPAETMLGDTAVAVHPRMSAMPINRQALHTAPCEQGDSIIADSMWIRNLVRLR